MKQQFLAETADTLRTYIYENNLKVVPESAHIKIFMPGGTLLVPRTPMGIGADGLLSYELFEADNSVPGLDYKAEVEYSVSSRTHYAVLFYDVVRSRLSKVITDDDIFAELPQLRDRGWSVSGAAEGGSETTIVDSRLKKYGDGYFAGGIASCPSKGEAREIRDFDAATGTLTVEAFSSEVVPGEKYVLTRSFSREIHRAFEKLEDQLKRLGKRPHLVLDSQDLRESHIFLSVAEACKGLASENKGIWWELWKEYEGKAVDAYSGLRLKYDYSGDGSITGAEGELAFGSLKAGRR
jgi:hypothetical protein